MRIQDDTITKSDNHSVCVEEEDVDETDGWMNDDSSSWMADDIGGWMEAEDVGDPMDSMQEDLWNDDDLTHDSDALDDDDGLDDEVLADKYEYMYDEYEADARHSSKNARTQKRGNSAFDEEDEFYFYR